MYIYYFTVDICISSNPLVFLSRFPSFSPPPSLPLPSLPQPSSSSMILWTGRLRSRYSVTCLKRACSAAAAAAAVAAAVPRKAISLSIHLILTWYTAVATGYLGWRKARFWRLGRRCIRNAMAVPGLVSLSQRKDTRNLSLGAWIERPQSLRHMFPPPSSSSCRALSLPPFFPLPPTLPV